MNQKRRTRDAILAAARALVDRGETPTVPRAAEAALVSRTTAYRYFPTQEALLLELSVTVSVEGIEGLLAATQDEASPEERVLELVDAFNSYVSANEVLHRTALRYYMDVWLAAERAGEGHDRELREGRRRRWISTALGPRRDTMSGPELQRLESALCLVMGGEAFTVLRDVCRLDPDEAMTVAHWAAEAILAAGLRNSLPERPPARRDPGVPHGRAR